MGFYVWLGVDVGIIEVLSGVIMVSVDDFEIEFIGKGGYVVMLEVIKNLIYFVIDFI